MAIHASQIFLSIICAVYLVTSFMVNFTFLTTLLKVRRLNKVDKSNFLLTHLILADFICAFFILVPSAYGIYNQGLQVPVDYGCNVQVYFMTFFISMTFYGLLALSIERYFKFKYPISHINFFTKRISLDEDAAYLPTKRIFHKTIAIILFLWLLSAFIAFIPMFRNIRDVDYFLIESQCDYVYENPGFVWWIWVYFFLAIVLPTFGACCFFTLTLNQIYANAEVINKRQNILRANQRQPAFTLSRGEFFLDMFFPFLTRKKTAVRNLEAKLDSARASSANVSDTTKLPENMVFYSHLISTENLDGEYENVYNDLHVRKQLLIQFKYDTERSKVSTFFLALIVSFGLVLPVFVIHFYRVYNLDYEDAAVIANYKNVYSAFVWISYIALLVKSAVCLIHNKFYRYSLYQSANCRGFHGMFDFQVEKIKNELKKIEEKLDKNTNNRDNYSSKSRKSLLP